jgi:hypothetical protein
MNSKWTCLTAIIAIPLALFLGGCKTSQPDLKPPKEPERLVPPPENINNNYPKQAMNFDAQGKGVDPNTVLPTRGMGGAGGPSMGGAGGMAPPGSFGGPGAPR